MNKKYIYAIPIFFFLLFLASLSGIIVSGINSVEQVSIRTFSSGILEPDEYSVFSLYIDEAIDSPELTLTVIPIPTQVDNNIVNPRIDLILLKNRPLNNYNSSFALFYQSEEYNQSLYDQIFNSGNQVDVEVSDFSGTNIYIALVNNKLNEFSYTFTIKARVYSTNAAMQGLIYSRIVISSILTVLFATLCVLSLIDLNKTEEKAKFLNDDLENQMQKYIGLMDSWQIIVIVISYLFIPFGLANYLGGNDSSMLILGIIGITFVLYLVHKRIQIREVLPKMAQYQQSVTITDLKTLLKMEKKQILREINEMIHIEGYPYTLDLVNMVLIFDKKEKRTINAIHETPTTKVGNIVEKPYVGTINTEQDIEVKQKCPFCGAEAVIAGAKFCAECGASMYSTK